MADTVEKTIFRLELDGSAYIEGVDKAATSTGKLSQSQEAANKKLTELTKQQQSYKKQLEEITLVIQANEKELVDLTRQYNALVAAGKGSTAETIKFKNAIRDITFNTREFKLEAAQLRTSLSQTTEQLKIQTKEVKAAEAASGGFSAGLTKTYGGLSRIAQLIPGLGIGGLVALISGPLINAFSEWAASLEDINKKQKILGEAFAEGDYQKAIKDVSLLSLNIKLAKEGFLDKTEVLKQYNDTLGKSLGHVKSLDEAEDNLVKKGPAYIQMTLLKAAANLALDKAAKLAVDAAIDLQEAQDKVITITRKGQAERDKAAGAAGLGEFLASGLKNEAAAAKDRADQGIQTLKNIAESFQKDAAEIAKQFGINFEPVPTPKIKPGSISKPITNIYEQELQKLRADIAKLDEKGFTDEATITKAIEEDFKKRALAFDKAFKNKQLTADQVNSLKGYLDSLQKLTLDQNLKSFREQKDAYLKQISTELENLQFEEATKRIATIQDRFERERQLIISETDKTVNALQDRRDKLIADISKNAAKNGLTPADIAPQIESIKNVYSKLLDDLEIIKNQKLQQLSFDTFEKLSEDAKRLLDAGNLGISQGSLINIKEQTALFLAGKISYEKYQKELTKIARFEANERFKIEKLFLESEIRIRKIKLDTDKSLTDEQIKRLQDEIRNLQQQLTNAEKGNAISTAGNANTDEGPSKVDNIAAYAVALGKVIDSVISFWQKANEEETKALDRSITLQQKRVDAAQRIAERGNAQYLKNEEDKLRDLEVKRENAARKQMGIDAALQASQILVGITGAISHIGTGTAVQTIAEIAVIIGALATGYGLVKSLQGNQPQLASGTKNLKRNGHPSGKDTIPAWLNEGEAVIPTHRNKAYHPTVAAIYDGSIPAEHLNQFVKNYHKVKSAPQVDYSRIKDAAELHIGSDGRMAVMINEQNKLIVENNELQKQTLRAMKNMAVSANIDKNGVAIMVNEYISQMKIDKRV